MEHARRLYSDGLTAVEIAPEVQRSVRTVRVWAQQHGWKKNSSPEARLEAAISALTDKSGKTEKDWNDLGRYSRNLAQLRRGDGKRAERVEQERKKDPAKGAQDSWLFAYQQKFLDDPSVLRIVQEFLLMGELAST